MTDMIQSHPDPGIIKTDTRGRVHTPPARREQLLDEFERSGLSGAKYAALVGVNYQTFAAWAKRRRQQQASRQEPSGQAPPAAQPLRWLEAVMTQECAAHGLVLHLPGGAQLAIANQPQAVLAAALLQALTKPC